MARPRAQIDYSLVEDLANIQCTQAEIAEVLGVSVRTLQRRKEFCRIYKKGIESGKSSLRRLQWKSAKRGNASMLIWLGKQYLGQKDKHEVSGDNENPITYTVKFIDGNPNPDHREVREIPEPDPEKN